MMRRMVIPTPDAKYMCVPSVRLRRSLILRVSDSGGPVYRTLDITQDRVGEGKRQ